MLNVIIYIFISLVPYCTIYFLGNLQGLPAILSVAVLQPCLRAEQLLITVDTHTGMLQCHVPQYDPPLVPELNNALNGDHSKLPMLISELRFWITQRRCEKTLQHLPATAYERLPLMHTADHEINHIGKHRMYVQLHRHPNVVLVSLYMFIILLLFKLNCILFLGH